MSRISADDQLKFLLCCVKHANNGKIDFTEVARECAVVSRSAACKRYDRLLKANGMTRNGSSKTEPKAKKRDADAIAKAAEEKRRKIEGDHNDPTADDDDIKPVMPKLELGTSPMIKPEPGSGYYALPYSSTFMQAQNADTPGYLPTSATSPTPGYPLNYTTAADEPSASVPWEWQNSSQIFPRSIKPLLSTRQEAHNQSPSISSPTILADCIKKETTREQTGLHSTTPSPRSQPATRQDLTLRHQQDTVFRDFCNSDLFMPPLQQKSTSPLAPSAQRYEEPRSREAEEPNDTPLDTSTLTANLVRPANTSNQPECIIIDD